jgi:hypothetical protein
MTFPGEGMKEHLMEDVTESERLQRGQVLSAQRNGISWADLTEDALMDGAEE